MLSTDLLFSVRIDANACLQQTLVCTLKPFFMPRHRSSQRARNVCPRDDGLCRNFFAANVKRIRFRLEAFARKFFCDLRWETLVSRTCDACRHRADEFFQRKRKWIFGIALHALRRRSGSQCFSSQCFSHFVPETVGDTDTYDKYLFGNATQSSLCRCMLDAASVDRPRPEVRAGSDPAEHPPPASSLSI